MKCNNCGKEILEGFKVCPYCTKPILETPEQSEELEFSTDTNSSIKTISKSKKKPIIIVTSIVLVLILVIAGVFITTDTKSLLTGSQEVTTTKALTPVEKLNSTETEIYNALIMALPSFYNYTEVKIKAIDNEINVVGEDYAVLSDRYDGDRFITLTIDCFNSYGMELYDKVQYLMFEGEFANQLIGNDKMVADVEENEVINYDQNKISAIKLNNALKYHWKSLGIGE